MPSSRESSQTRAFKDRELRLLGSKGIKRSLSPDALHEERSRKKRQDGKKLLRPAKSEYCMDFFQ